MNELFWERRCGKRKTDDFEVRRSGMMFKGIVAISHNILFYLFTNFSPRVEMSHTNAKYLSRNFQLSTYALNKLLGFTFSQMTSSSSNGSIFLLTNLLFLSSAILRLLLISDMEKQVVRQILHKMPN